MKENVCRKKKISPHSEKMDLFRPEILNKCFTLERKSQKVNAFVMFAARIQLLTGTPASLISSSLEHLSYAHCCDLFICFAVFYVSRPVGLEKFLLIIMTFFSPYEQSMRSATASVFINNKNPILWVSGWLKSPLHTTHLRSCTLHKCVSCIFFA